MSRRVRAARHRAGQAAEWRPIIDAISILLVIVAFFTFLYFAVAYRYLEIFFKPATVMLAMLSAGMAMGITLGGAIVRSDVLSLSAAAAGALACLGLVGVQQIIGVMKVPAQGVVIELSPFWVVLFYFSVGVAEESAFTLMMFSSLVRAGVHPIISLALKSAFFVAYHNFVALQMFGKPIFEVASYSMALYAGSIILTAAFYYTRHFSVPALGHGLLNAIVQIRVLSGGA